MFPRVARASAPFPSVWSQSYWVSLHWHGVFNCCVWVIPHPQCDSRNPHQDLGSESLNLKWGLLPQPCWAVCGARTHLGHGVTALATAGEQSPSWWGCGVLCPSCCWGGGASAWPEVGKGLCCCQEGAVSPCCPGDGCGRAQGELAEQRGGTQLLLCVLLVSVFIPNRALLLPLWERGQGQLAEGMKQCGWGGDGWGMPEQEEGWWEALLHPCWSVLLCREPRRAFPAGFPLAAQPLAHAVGGSPCQKQSAESPREPPATLWGSGALWSDQGAAVLLCWALWAQAMLCQLLAKPRGGALLWAACWCQGKQGSFQSAPCQGGCSSGQLCSGLLRTHSSDWFQPGLEEPTVVMFLMGETGLCCSVCELLIHALGLSHCTSSPVLLCQPCPALHRDPQGSQLCFSCPTNEHWPFSQLGGEECAWSEEKTCPFSEKNPHCSTALFVSYLNSKWLGSTSVTLDVT